VGRTIGIKNCMKKKCFSFPIEVINEECKSTKTLMPICENIIKR